MHTQKHRKGIACKKKPLERKPCVCVAKKATRSAARRAHGVFFGARLHRTAHRTPKELQPTQGYRHGADKRERARGDVFELSVDARICIRDARALARVQCIPRGLLFLAQRQRRRVGVVYT